MKKDKRLSKDSVLARLDSARLAVPDRWSVIEGQLDTRNFDVAARDMESTGATIRVPQRRIPRLVPVFNILLALVLATVAGMIWMSREKSTPAGTTVPAAIATTTAVRPTGEDVPRYPVSSRWVTMLFRSTALTTCRSGAIDRVERFDPDTGDWTPVLPHYRYAFDAGAGTMYGYSLKFAMIDLDEYPLEPGLYRASMSIQRVGKEPAVSRAEFEIVESGRNPELALGLLKDPRALPSDLAYGVDGLDWGMSKAEVFTALGLTEADFTRDGDTYARTEPMRFRYPDVDAIASYTFENGELSAAQYNVVSVSTDNLYQVCGQLAGLRKENMRDDPVFMLESEYFACLISGGNRGSSITGQLSIEGSVRGVTVKLSPYLTGEVPQNATSQVKPIGEVNGIPQYPVNAESIMLTFRHESLIGAYSMSVNRYEWFNPATGKWQQVMQGRYSGMGPLSNEATYTRNWYTYMLSIGDPLFEAPLPVGHYRAYMTIHTVDKAASTVTDTESVLEFDLVEWG